MKRCVVAGCTHPAGYQSAGDEVADYCACHFWDEDHPFHSECDPYRVPASPDADTDRPRGHWCPDPHECRCKTST